MDVGGAGVARLLLGQSHAFEGGMGAAAAPDWRPAGLRRGGKQPSRWKAIELPDPLDGLARDESSHERDLLR